jgi:hypothetical protein
VYVWCNVRVMCWIRACLVLWGVLRACAGFHLCGEQLLQFMLLAVADRVCICPDTDLLAVHRLAKHVAAPQWEVAAGLCQNRVCAIFTCSGVISTSLLQNTQRRAGGVQSSLTLHAHPSKPLHALQCLSIKQPLTILQGVQPSA